MSTVTSAINCRQIPASQHIVIVKSVYVSGKLHALHP